MTPGTLRRLVPDFSVCWWILTLPLFWASTGRRYPFEAMGAHGAQIGIAFWFLISAIWTWGLFRVSSEANTLTKIVERALPALVAISLFLVPGFDLLNWRHFSEFGYQFPLLPLVLDGMTVLLFLARTRWWLEDGRRLFALLAGFGVLHLAAVIAPFPIAIGRSDMIPSIQKAWDLFSQGRSAYDFSFHPGHRMGYPPFMWLPYWPAHALQIDFRWVNVSIRAGLAALLYWRFRERRLTLVYFGLFFANPNLLFRHDTCLDFFWFACVSAAIAADKESILATGLLSGVLFATIQWGWIPVPFLLLLAARRKGWMGLLGSASIALGFAALVYGYFYKRDGEIFVSAMTHWGNPGELRAQLVVDYCLGLSSGLLQIVGIGTLQILQIAWVGFCGITALRSCRRSQILQLAVLASLGFVLLNPLLTSYYYFGPLLLAGYASRESLQM
ncbi:MAG: hypothetical protein ACXWPM_09680 [Bdellovibrionota bacterium]